jgi:hypothetical protein
MYSLQLLLLREKIAALSADCDASQKSANVWLSDTFTQHAIHCGPQALTQRLHAAEETSRSQANTAADEAKAAQERHEANADSWSAERASLEAKLAKQRQESAAAAATSLTAIEQLKSQVHASPSFRYNLRLVAQFVISSICHAFL